MELLTCKDTFYKFGSGGSYHLWMNDDDSYGEFGWSHFPDAKSESDYAVWRSTEYYCMEDFLACWNEKKEEAAKEG